MFKKFFPVVDAIAVSNPELVEFITTLFPFKWCQVMLQSVYCMWLFLINPLKLCSYGSWSLQGYVCTSSCRQYQIYIYIYNLAWILKCLKTLSISLVDDSAAATQPLSRHARVADAATQPLSHPARVADAATQPLWVTECRVWLSGWGENVRHWALNRLCFEYVSMCL